MQIDYFQCVFLTFDFGFHLKLCAVSVTLFSFICSFCEAEKLVLFYQSGYIVS